MTNLNNLEIKSRIDIIEEAEAYFDFSSPITYEAGTLICLKMEDRFVRVIDIVNKLKRLSIYNYQGMGIEYLNTIINNLIKELERNER